MCSKFWGKEKKLQEKYILKTLVSKEKYMQSENGEMFLSPQTSC